MILAFKNFDKVLLLIGVSDEKILSVASPVSNYVFERVSDLDKRKSFSENDVFELADTIKVVESLSDMAKVKEYVIVELEKLKFSFVNEMSVAQYKVFFKRWWRRSH